MKIGVGFAIAAANADRDRHRLCAAWGKHMAPISAVRCRSLSQGRMKQLLVDVVTRDGDVGTGETWWGIASTTHAEATDAATRPMQAAVEALLAPRCVGEDADNIESLWFKLADWAARYGDGGII